MSVSIKQKQNIPHGWSETEVIDVLEVNPEQTNPADSPDYFFQYIDISSVKEFLIQDIKIVTGASAPGRARRIVNVGDILISNVRPNLKGICRVPDYHVKTLCSTGFSVLRPKKIDAMFAYQVFSQDIFTNYLVDKTTGSSYPAVNSADVAGYSFLLPNDIAEQQRIAEILGAVDENIEKTKATIKATEKLKRGLMQELFTRGIGHTKFKQTELGEIPEDWTVSHLSDVSSKVGDGLHGTPEYIASSEFFFINGNNVVNKKIKIHSSTKYISENEYKKHKKDLDHSTVLLSINGTIGSVGLYNGEQVALGKSVAYIKCRANMLRNFLAYQLETSRIANSFTRELTGSTIKNLSLKTIRQTLLVVPEMSEQQEIVEILQTVDDKITVNKRLLVKQTELKNGLMQDLLSGKVRTTIN